MFLISICFFETSAAENTHEDILGQSLNSSQVAQVLPKKKERQLKKRPSSRSFNRLGPKTSSGATIVRGNQFRIDSHNTITNSIDSEQGANIAIGGTDISNVQVDSAIINTENTVYGRVKARGDNSRYRMGTVDIEGIHGGNLGISTENTTKGTVSVQNGQDVAIGVVEIGSAGENKKDPPISSQPNPEDNVAEYMEIIQHGRAITLPWYPNDATIEDTEVNEVCSGGTLCNPGECCEINKISEKCYLVDGCSAVRDQWKNGRFIFGTPGGDFKDVDSYVPCNSHDQCYQTCGTDRKACDIQMYYDMIDVCRSDKDEIIDWNKKNILMPDDVWSKFHTGAGAMMLSPTVALTITRIPKVDRQVSIITNAAYSNEIDRTKKTLLLAVCAIIEPNATNLSNSVSKNNNIKKQTVQNYKNQLNKRKDIDKKLINIATDNSTFLVYDISNIAENAGRGINRLLDQAAAIIEPDDSFVDSVFQPPTNSCGAAGSFWKSITCNIRNSTAQATSLLSSAAVWSAQKAGHLFLKGAGQVANYTGQLLAADVRFYGILGVKSLEYAGYSVLEVRNYANQASINMFDLTTDFRTVALSFGLDQLSKAARYAGDLIFDCLTAAETYYIGLRDAGWLFFRGEKEQCTNNIIPKDSNDCCVVNPNYAYHGLPGIEATMGDIPIPFQTYCEEKAGN